MFKKGITVAALIAMAATLTYGCGNNDSEIAKTDAAQCHTNYAALVGSISELDATLNVNISPTDYSVAVTSLNSDNSTLQYEDMGEDCKVLVQQPITSIIKKYSTVDSQWQNYINYGEDFNPGAIWTKAEGDVKAINENMNTIESISTGDTDSGDYDVTPSGSQIGTVS